MQRRSAQVVAAALHGADVELMLVCLHAVAGTLFELGAALGSAEVHRVPSAVPRQSEGDPLHVHTRRDRGVAEGVEEAEARVAGGEVVLVSVVQQGTGRTSVGAPLDDDRPQRAGLGHLNGGSGIVGTGEHSAVFVLYLRAPPLSCRKDVLPADSGLAEQVAGLPREGELGAAGIDDHGLGCFLNLHALGRCCRRLHVGAVVKHVAALRAAIDRDREGDDSRLQAPIRPARDHPRLHRQVGPDSVLHADVRLRLERAVRERDRLGGSLVLATGADGLLHCERDDLVLRYGASGVVGCSFRGSGVGAGEVGREDRQFRDGDSLLAVAGRGDLDYVAGLQLHLRRRQVVVPEVVSRQRRLLHGPAVDPNRDLRLGVGFIAQPERKEILAFGQLCASVLEGPAGLSQHNGAGFCPEAGGRQPCRRNAPEVRPHVHAAEERLGQELGFAAALLVDHPQRDAHFALARSRVGDVVPLDPLHGRVRVEPQHVFLVDHFAVHQHLPEAHALLHVLRTADASVADHRGIGAATVVIALVDAEHHL